MWRWLTLLALPLLLWSAYWGVGAYALRHGVESGLQDQNHGHVATRYAHAQLSGFPTEFALNMSELELYQAGVFSWRLPEVKLQAPSHQPQNIRLDVAGEQRIETALGDLTLMAEVLEVEVFFRPSLSLPLARAQLRSEGARLVHGEEVVDGWEVGLERLLMELRGLDEIEHDGTILHPYDLTLDAVALDLSQSGLNLPPSHHRLDSLRADLALAFTRSWDLSVLDQGAPRLDTIVIRSLAMQAGESELRVTGQLLQGPTGFLFGELVVDIENWRDVLTVLRDAGYVDPDVVALIVEFLGAQYPGTQMTLPLSVQNGQIQLGVFTLGVLPALP